MRGSKKYLKRKYWLEEKESLEDIKKIKYSEEELFEPQKE